MERSVNPYRIYAIGDFEALKVIDSPSMEAAAVTIADLAAQGFDRSVWIAAVYEGPVPADERARINALAKERTEKLAECKRLERKTHEDLNAFIAADFARGDAFVRALCACSDEQGIADAANALAAAAGDSAAKMVDYERDKARLDQLRQELR